MNLTSIIPWKKEDPQVARGSEGGEALLQRRMNSLFDDFFGRSCSDLWSGFGRGFAPQIALSETDTEVRISAELPGLEEKEVEVTLSDNVLTIKGEKKEEHEEEKTHYYHSECSYGYFERAVQLPPGVDADKAKAKFKKGVLKVAIPRSPKRKAREERLR